MMLEFLFGAKTEGGNAADRSSSGEVFLSFERDICPIFREMIGQNISTRTEHFVVELTARSIRGNLVSLFKSNGNRIFQMTPDC